MAHVAHKDQPGALLLFAQDGFRIDHPTVGQRHGEPSSQIAAHRAVGNAQCLCFLGQEWPPAFLFEEKTKAVGTPMLHGKRREGELFALELETRAHQVERHAHVGELPRAKDDFHERLHPCQRHRAAVDVEFLQRLPAAQRAGQPAQAQDVVQVAVGEQNLV